MNKWLLAVLSLCSCGGSGSAISTGDASDSADWDEATKVEYRYGDKSLPPDYHRSYTIAVSSDSVAFSVDSYGTTLLDTRYPNTPGAFNAFKDELASKGIKKHKEVDAKGCSGGYTETINLYKDDSRFFSAYVYHCSGESGTLTLPAGVASMFRRQVPEDVDSLIDSTRRNNSQ